MTRTFAFDIEKRKNAMFFKWHHGFPGITRKTFLANWSFYIGIDKNGLGNKFEYNEVSRFPSSAGLCVPRAPRLRVSV